mgnify:CR=1 FL=1
MDNEIILIGKEYRFYSTYEELKRSLIPPSTKATASFYSTYEELKLASYKCNTAKQSKVFTVPMRNWNK